MGPLQNPSGMEAYKTYKATLKKGFDRESDLFEGILEQELFQRE